MTRYKHHPHVYRLSARKTANVLETPEWRTDITFPISYEVGLEYMYEYLKKKKQEKMRML